MLPLGLCSQGDLLEQPVLVWIVEGQEYPKEPALTFQGPQGCSWVPKPSQPESGTLLSVAPTDICKLSVPVLSTETGLCEVRESLRGPWGPWQGPVAASCAPFLAQT